MFRGKALRKFSGGLAILIGTDAPSTKQNRTASAAKRRAAANLGPKQAFILTDRPVRSNHSQADSTGRKWATGKGLVLGLGGVPRVIVTRVASPGGVKSRVGGDECQGLDEGGRGDEAVEGVFVVEWEGRKGTGRMLLDDRHDGGQGDRSVVLGDGHALTRSQSMHKIR